MKKIEKIWKKKSFGFGKKNFGSDTDTHSFGRNSAPIPNFGRTLVVTLLLSIHDRSMHSLFSDIMFFGISSIPCNLGSISNYWNTKNSTIVRRHLLDFIWRWQWIAHKCLLRGSLLFRAQGRWNYKGMGQSPHSPRFWQKQKKNLLHWKTP